MINRARHRGKYVPTYQEIIELWPKDMMCPVENCSHVMILRPVNGKRGRIISLQHHDDGTIELICHRCNNRHGHSNHKDRVLLIKEGMRICSECGEEKELNSENFYRNRKEPSGFRYICRGCANNRRNVERVNARKRKRDAEVGSQEAEKR